MDTECRSQQEEDDSQGDTHPRKRIKLKARRGAATASGADKKDMDCSQTEDTSVQTLPVAGGPDNLTLRRFDLWKEDHLYDCALRCSDGALIRASRLELAVWSQHFADLFKQTSWKGATTEVSIGNLDSDILAVLIRALYEKEITITPRNATELLALAHHLQIEAVARVVESYLVSQCDHKNAIELLLLAEKHNCPHLKQTAIPLTATNFDRIDPEQLVLLTASDMKLLLASDQLSSTEEQTLFGIVKRWSQGPQAGAGGADLEEQLLSLVGEIRLEHVPPQSMTSILDDPWLHKHPKVMSEVAKGLVRHAGQTPLNRKNRVGKLVRFTGWSRRVQELRARNSRDPLYSDDFQLPLPTEAATQWHMQAYPQGFTLYPGKIGLYLAGAVTNEKENQGAALGLRFRITLVNQHNAKDSITGEFAQPSNSTGGSLQFWGSRQFADADILDKGFLVNNTLCISVLPVPQDSKFSQSSPGGKRAFSLVNHAETTPMSATKSNKSNQAGV